MDEKTIQIIPFTGEKEKWRMWSGKSTAGSGIKVYHVILTGAKKIPANDAEKTKEKENSALKLLKFTAYNEIILAQEDTVYFQIFEGAKKRANKYGYARLAWKNFQ